MSFLISEKQREPFLRAPASVLLLIAALALAHLARMIVPAQLSEDILYQYAFIPARYAAGGPQDGLLALTIPFVSHIFLHASFWHLAVNCLWLLAFGPVVARRFGAGLFLVFFLLCGIAGAATFLVLNWSSPVEAIGASGAISGLMAAGIRLFPWPGATVQQVPAPILSSQILFFSGVWLVTNLVFGLIGFGVGENVQFFAWQGHLGGFVAGLLLTDVFDRLRPRRLAL